MLVGDVRHHFGPGSCGRVTRLRCFFDPADAHTEAKSSSSAISKWTFGAAPPIALMGFKLALTGAAYVISGLSLAACGRAAAFVTCCRYSWSGGADGSTRPEA